jgi:hypothetical protein
MTRARRAAHTLVWLAGLFALGEIAFAATIECDLAPARDPLAQAKWQRLRAVRRADPDRPLALMLGSSRTLLGLQADLLDSPGRRGFNFGLAGTGPLEEWLIWRRLCDAGIRPRLLLVEVFPPLLQGPVSGLVSEEDWLNAAKHSGVDLVRLGPYLTDAGRLARNWFVERLKPAYSNRRAWCDLLALNGPPPETELGDMDAAGWQPLRAADITATNRAALTDVDLHRYGPTLRNLRPCGGPAWALRDLLANARRRSVPTVLVLMPENTAFRAAYGPEARRAVQDFLGATGGPLIDARTWLPDEAFWDGHHLLPGAAGIFTRRLREELTRYGG